MPNIWGRRGNLIGSTVEGRNGTKVYDEKNQPAGQVTGTGTYDKNGRKVTDSKEPGLLLKK